MHPALKHVTPFRIFVALIFGVCVYFGYSLYSASTVRDRIISATDRDKFFTQENANIGIVEYLDYSCSSCQKMHPIIQEAILRDGQVNFTVKPIDSGYEGSDAGRLVYSAGLQGKFMPAHDFIVRNGHKVDEVFLDAMALELDLDREQLEKDMRSHAAYDYLDQNGLDMHDLGGQYLPAFVIGQDMIFYATPELQTVEGFLKVFENVRKMFPATQNPVEQEQQNSQ